MGGGGGGGGGGEGLQIWSVKPDRDPKEKKILRFIFEPYFRYK